MAEMMDDSGRQILELEREALTRWGKGDPDGYVAISDDSVSYFDPLRAERIDGRSALIEYYAPIRGRIRIESDEIVEPRVQLLGDAAVLTFNYLSRGTEGSMHWHCTEVFRRCDARWRIVHTHWSLVAKPGA